MDQLTKQRVVRLSVVLPIYCGFLAAVFVSFNRGAFRVGAVIMLAFIFGSPFMLKFLVPRALARFAPGPVANIPLDAAGRIRIVRRIRREKIWIAVLMILFPIGVASGAAQRAWLPTLGGAAISLFLMYASLQKIRLLRKSLGSDIAVGETPG